MNFFKKLFSEESILKNYKWTTVALSILVLYYSFWFFLWIVEWPSMEPTLITSQRVIYSKTLSIFWLWLDRGDIVVTRQCKWWYWCPKYIKRVVCLPWDYAYKLFDNTYSCTTNKELLEQKWVSYKKLNWYFLMWDNRSNSLDSRECFSYDGCKDSSAYDVSWWKIVGKVIYVFK